MHDGLVAGSLQRLQLYRDTGRKEGKTKNGMSCGTEKIRLASRIGVHVWRKVSTWCLLGVYLEYVTVTGVCRNGVVIVEP